MLVQSFTIASQTQNLFWKLSNYTLLRRIITYNNHNVSSSVIRKFTHLLPVKCSCMYRSTTMTYGWHLLQCSAGPWHQRQIKFVSLFLKKVQFLRFLWSIHCTFHLLTSNLSLQFCVIFLCLSSLFFQCSYLLCFQQHSCQVWKSELKCQTTFKIGLNP